MEAVAKFMFTASQGDELSFEKGSVLNVSWIGFVLQFVTLYFLLLPGFKVNH